MTKKEERITISWIIWTFNHLYGELSGIIFAKVKHSFYLCTLFERITLKIKYKHARYIRARTRNARITYP